MVSTHMCGQGGHARARKCKHRATRMRLGVPMSHPCAIPGLGADPSWGTWAQLSRSPAPPGGHLLFLVVSPKLASNSHFQRFSCLGLPKQEAGGLRASATAPGLDLCILICG